MGQVAERKGGTMTGLCTTVTNAKNGKSYFVSTVRRSHLTGLYEASVFRKIVGPFANFWRPQATFVGSDAADLHARTTTLVRDFDPTYWNVRGPSSTVEQR